MINIDGNASNNIANAPSIHCFPASLSIAAKKRRIVSSLHTRRSSLNSLAMTASFWINRTCLKRRPSTIHVSRKLTITSRIGRALLLVRSIGQVATSWSMILLRLRNEANAANPPLVVSDLSVRSTNTVPSDVKNVYGIPFTCWVRLYSPNFTL